LIAVHPSAVSKRGSCMLSRMAESAKTNSIPAKPTLAKARSKTRSEAKPDPGAEAHSDARPEVRFRMRIRKGTTVALGPGKVELLEAVRDHGSISAAARSLDMSYRRAWLLIDELNQSLKSPATVSEQGGQSGGGCTLTPVGESIVQLYRDVEVQAQKACARQIGDLIRLMRP
jgi:molybdate transport system regulatory protein